jgi:hypothetical protein
MIPLLSPRRTLAVARAVPGKDEFSYVLRVLCAFAVRLQTMLTINTQEGDYSSLQKGQNG